MIYIAILIFDKTSKSIIFEANHFINVFFGKDFIKVINNNSK